MSFQISKKTRFTIFLALAALFMVGWQVKHTKPKTITRVAIDVGSGSIKVTLAKVDHNSQKIKEILYSQEHPIPFKRDIQVGKKSELSEKIQTVAMNTLANVQKELAVYKPVEWKGIATAASREAKNAQNFYDRIHEILGMNISIISQNEEGRLGFATAAAVSGIPVEQLLAVDSGSGSFQLTAMINGDLKVIEGQLGYIPSLEALMEIRNQTLDLQTPPSPVTLKEAEQLVEKLRAKMPQVSDAFVQKIQDPTTSIVGIGNENFIFAMGATGVGKPNFTKEELWQAIVRHAGKPAEEMKQFSKPNTAVLGMVLLYSIMDSIGLDHLTAYYANGSCEGLLVDASYWSPLVIG